MRDLDGRIIWDGLEAGSGDPTGVTIIALGSTSRREKRLPSADILYKVDPSL